MIIFLMALTALSAARPQEPAVTGPQTEARFPPLIVPPGFKATLFACDPLIEYPSVIAAGPRPGAIFVAIDYMTGLGTDIVRRSEVRLVEDTDGDGYADRAPVFADGFNSIEGLAWHDGTLLVMHAPFLTAVREKQGAGKATERRDLLAGLGLKPEDNPVRLHCANGVAAGHDGWLYLALGDHGCDVQRPEGDRLVLQGGGILRCRPDGHDLHVFATGLRNIYDVALDEELNVFVRDNENDGGTYKIRVCHSFFGADHGYPYLYEERLGEALPPLADLGLGSSAGGVCYLERQFPAEFRGNLFFCEWGKSIVRYPLRPSGSGFEAPAEVEFAAGAPKDSYGFKPTDIVVQRDGTLMVSDYADGQRPKRGRGRIYHISYVGNAAEHAGRKSGASSDAPGDLLAQLDSDSHFERCDAQHAIELEGQSGLAKIRQALRQRRLAARGRLHAVWILARGVPSAAIEELLQLAESDAESKVRAQAIRAIADLADPVLIHHRLDAPEGDPALAARLAVVGKQPNPWLLREVCVALGRLRWPDTASWLQENLKDPDPPLAHAAMLALRRSGNWSATLKFLDLPDQSTLRPIALAVLAEQYELAVVDGLIERLASEKDDSRRYEYADLLTRVYKKPGPWVYWGYRPPPRPANTAAWERTETIAGALDRALTNSDPAMRLTLLHRMQREQIPLAAATLAQWLETERQADRVAAILQSLRDQRGLDIRPRLKDVIGNSDHSLANRRTALVQFAEGLTPSTAEELLSLCKVLEDGPVLADALRLLVNYPKLDAIALLTSKLNAASAEVRAAAIEALGEKGQSVAREQLLPLLSDGDPRVRRSAASAAGKLAFKEGIELLLKMAEDDEPAVRRASFESLHLLREERVVPLAVAALGDGEVNLQALKCVTALGGPAQAAAITELAQHSPRAEVLTAAIVALTAWSHRPSTSAATRQTLEKAVAEIQGATGVLLRWNVSGPISAGEAPAVVEQLTSGKNDSVAAAWPTVLASGTDAHLVLTPKDTPMDRVWLANTMLCVSDSVEVEFLAASSGSLRIWLNGQLIHQRDEPQSFRIDSDRFAGQLAKGDNRLVVMVARSAAPVECQVRFRRKSATLQQERLTQAALARPGNADRGRQIFLNVEKSLCLKCHRVGDQGERTGPELTGLGGRFSRIFVVESILEPSRTIAPSFGSMTVLLKDGQILSGIKTAETPTQITLVDNQAQKHTPLKSDIDEQKSSSASAMPDGLEKRLTEQEFVDLIGYLMSLKESRAP